jgi:hypothetical protein
MRDALGTIIASSRLPVRAPKSDQEPLGPDFQDLVGLLPISLSVDAGYSPHLSFQTSLERGIYRQRLDMGQVIQFISKAERERIRLIREARAMYDHVFPASDSVNEPRDKTLTTLTVNGANAHHGDKVLS